MRFLPDSHSSKPEETSKPGRYPAHDLSRTHPCLDSKDTTQHTAKPRPYMPDANAPGRAPPMKKCWPCRRRRLKCDGTVPRCEKCRDNGVECTYTKPLTWVNGVASRGRMMGCTFDELYAARDDSSSQRNLTRRPANTPALRLLPNVPGDISAADGPAPVSRALTDPIFQDLGYNERFLVDYCEDLVFQSASDGHVCS